MRKSAIVFFCFLLFACNTHSNNPDVSNINVHVEVRRFENELFSTDTNHMLESVLRLQQLYPRFSADFFSSILGLDPDSLLMKGSSQALSLKTFIRDYRFMKDTASIVFSNFEKQKKEIEQGLRYVKYYFPTYKLPDTVITFIGPIDANFETSFGTQGDIITPEGLGIGLQLHMGAAFSLYRTDQGMERYPEYLSQTFTPGHIVVDCFKNIVDDLYPDNSIGKPLIEQVVEKGKRYYLLDQFLPAVPDYMKIAYSEKQMKDAYANEAVIWDFFLNNELLNNAEQNTIKNYIGESPKTQELGEDSPGNLGSFSGWQIVKKYMGSHPNTSLQQLMNLDPREIYAQAKYKPRT
ncbi:MAG: hypothetical protein ABJA57_13245 [Ginsengibacter sp.]